MRITIMEDSNEISDNVRPFWRHIRAWWHAKTSTEEDVMPAKVAYCKSTYGSAISSDYLIKMHQHQINRLIKDKTQYRTNGDQFTDYRCVYSFPPDSIPYIDQVLQIFRDNGYSVINLSEKVEEIKNDHVYLISWFQDHI